MFIYIYMYTQCNTKVMRVFIGVKMLTDVVTWHNQMIPFFQDTVVCLLCSKCQPCEPILILSHDLQCLK